MEEVRALPGCHGPGGGLMGELRAVGWMMGVRWQRLALEVR